MKRTLFNLFALLIVLSLTLTACGGGAAPVATEAPVVEAPAVNEEPAAATEAPAAAEEVTITICFTASQTGAQ